MCSKRKLGVKTFISSLSSSLTIAALALPTAVPRACFYGGKGGVSRVFNPDGSLHFFPNISSHLWRAERAARERVLHFHVSFRVLLSRDFSRLPLLAGYGVVIVTIVLF